MQTGNFRKTLCAGLLVIVSMTMAVGQKVSRADSPRVIPTETLLRILRAEDERRWDENVRVLLGAGHPIVRKRAALALGRIGDERAVPALIDVMKADVDQDVRQMAAFAIGEIESPAGADALIAVLEDARQPAEVRARAVEALGKIGAVLLSNSGASGDQSALPKTEDKPLAKIRLAILEALKFEAGRRATADRFTILLGLTAALRARPDGAGPVVATFLDHTDPRIVADALNTMARLRLKDGNDQVRQLLGNGDAIVRANAARVIGAAEDKQAFDALLSRALNDYDLRVRVSAIRALGSLKDVRAVEPLVQRGNFLLVSEELAKTSGNELLEITTALGRLIPNRANDGAVMFLRKMHSLTKGEAVEVEIAFARIVPGVFQNDPYKAEITKRNVSWRQLAVRAQGLSAIRDVIAGAATGSAGDAALKDAQKELAELLGRPKNPTLAVADILQAYSSFKPSDADEVARKHLHDSDVIIRATAAEMLGTLPSEANARALIEALPVAFRDTDLNDAALAILDALAKQKSAAGE